MCMLAVLVGASHCVGVPARDSLQSFSGSCLGALRASGMQCRPLQLVRLFGEQRQEDHSVDQ